MLVDTGNSDGRTAMHLAASEGRDHVMKLLIKAEGHAAEAVQLVSIRFHPALSGNVNLQDRWKGTPLRVTYLEQCERYRSHFRYSGYSGYRMYMNHLKGVVLYSYGGTHLFNSKLCMVSAFFFFNLSNGLTIVGHAVYLCAFCGGVPMTQKGFDDLRRIELRHEYLSLQQLRMR